MHPHQRVEGSGPFRRIVQHRETRVRRAHFRQALEGGVTDDRVRIVQQRGDLRAGGHHVLAARADDRFQPGARVTALESGVEESDRHGRPTFGKLVEPGIAQRAQDEAQERRVRGQRRDGMDEGHRRLRLHGTLGQRVKRSYPRRQRLVRISRKREQRVLHGGSPGAAQQRALGFERADLAGRFEQGHQLLLIRLLEIRQRFGSVAFWRHADDVADVRPAPFEGRALPARLIDRAHPVHIGIGRAGQLHQRLGLGDLLESCAVRLDRVPPERVVSPVAGERRVVPLRGESRLGQISGTAASTAAVVGERLDDFVAEIDIHPRVAVVLEAGEMVETHVPAAAVVGIVPGEEIEQRTDGCAEDVAGAGAEDFQSRAIRPETDDGTGAVLKVFSITTDGVHEAEIPTGNVEPAIDTEAQAIGGVVGGALVEPEGDAFDQGLPFVGFPIAITVDKAGDVRGMDDIEAVVIPNHAARRIEVLDEFRGLVRLAVLVRIPQADNPSTAGIAAKRPIPIGCDIQIPTWRGGDVDRIVCLRGGGEKRDVEALRHGHVLQNLRFLFRTWPFIAGRRVAAFLIILSGGGQGEDA